MTKRLSDTEARQIMIDAGAEPLVAFPGTSRPWLSKCLKCKKEISPTLGNVKNQGTRACAYCAKKKVHTDDAVKIMQFVLPKCEILFITKTWFYFENKNIFVHSDA